MSVFSAYRVSAYSRFTVSSRCACVLQFRQGVSLARPGSFPIRQLTCKRSRLVIMGITLAMLFSQAPCGLFFRYRAFYLRAHKGAIMALFYRLSFPHDSRTPKIACFACAD